MREQFLPRISWIMSECDSELERVRWVLEIDVRWGALLIHKMLRERNKLVIELGSRA